MGRKPEFIDIRRAKVELSKLTRPALLVIKRTVEQTEDPVLAYQASRWVAETAMGKPKQRTEIGVQELVQVEIRIVGADGLPFDGAEPGELIERQARELPEGE